MKKLKNALGLYIVYFKRCWGFPETDWIKLIAELLGVIFSICLMILSPLVALGFLIKNWKSIKEN